jgi:hypothetical protein
VGAALTYARRYALFALVGIAGEDDLDAPELGADPNPAPERPRQAEDGKQSNGQGAAGQRAAPARGKVGPPARSILGEQLSATLRESLIEQLAGINSPDEAAAWAHRNIHAKNSLTAADAKIVEEQFRVKVAAISDLQPFETTSGDPARGGRPDGPLSAEGQPSPAIPDQSVMSTGASTAGTSTKASKGAQKVPADRAALHGLGKTVRLRDKDHRRFVLRQSCLVCGRIPSDPHHLTFTQPRALGRRVSDEFMVPVCRVHHRELHRSGDEAAWWRRLNIDPIPIALRLWQQTRADGEFPPRQGVTQAQTTKTLDVSAHDRARTSRDARTAASSAVRKNSEGPASR